MARELIKLKASKPIFHANSNALYDFRHFAAFSADPIHPKKPSGWPKALIGSPCHGVIELLAATKNEGKLKEIEKLFTGGSIRVKLYFLPDFNITVDCPETGETFIERMFRG